LRADPGYTAIGIGRRTLDDAGYRVLDLAAPGAGAALDALGFVPDVIVHAAARSSPWGTRAEFERDNVQTTRVLVDFARRAGSAGGSASTASTSGSARSAASTSAAASGSATRPRFVFVSTASVLYRAADQLGVPDHAPVGPRFVNGYAASKFAAEQVVRGYQGEWVVLRPRAVFGPGDSTLFPRVVEAAQRGRLPRFRTGQGRSTGRVGAAVMSDLVYIDSLVQYLVGSLTAPGVVGRTLTVTNGEPVDLQETVFALLARLGIPAPRRAVSRRGALWAATAVEAFWRLARRAGEPPITRYSVIVYAYSKTFDAQPCRRLLGDPAVSVADGIDRFVASLATEGHR
jgi:nucleoside-diphosphate-sugar epimerase